MYLTCLAYVPHLVSYPLLRFVPSYARLFVYLCPNPGPHTYKYISTTPVYSIVLRLNIAFASTIAILVLLV